MHCETRTTQQKQDKQLKQLHKAKIHDHFKMIILKYHIKMTVYFKKMII